MSRPSSLARRCNSRFHERHARAVAAAAVGGDHKPRGFRVSGAADFSPPAADRLNRECRCVMIHADTDPTGVVGQIVDAIGDRPAQFLDQEVVHPNVLRLTCGTPFPTGVLEVSDEFLLLRIDRDHRFARGQRRGHGVVDVNELRIAVGMAVAFPSLAIGLQAELLLMQQLANHRAADPVAFRRQSRRQLRQAFAGPAQRGHRIAARTRIDQRQQVGQESRVLLHQRLAPAAAPPHPADIQRVRACQFLQATTDRAGRNAGRRRYRRDGPISGGPSLARRPQTAIAFTQMPGQRGEALANRTGIDHPNPVANFVPAVNRPPFPSAALAIRLSPDGP